MTPEFSLAARFQYSAEAHIYRAKLADAGIEVFMRDHITIDSDPLVSNAIGGVKLMVRTVDLERAKVVLDGIENYSLEDDGTPVHCPACGSQKVEMSTGVSGTWPILKFVVVALMGLFPIVRHRYRCNDCGNTFKG